MQAAEQLPAHAAVMRSQGLSNVANLGQMKADYDRSRAYFNQQNYGMARREYESEAGLAGALESAGRTNLNQTLNAAIPQIGAAMSPLFVKRSAIPEMADMEQRLSMSQPLMRRYSSMLKQPLQGMMNPRYDLSSRMAPGQFRKTLPW